MRKEVLPIILGMNPPTKLCTLMKTERPLSGIALFISDVTYKEGVRKGDVIKASDVAENNGLRAWIHFKDADDLRRFGQMCMDFADGKVIKKPEDKKCNTCTNTSEGSSSIV